MISGEKSEATGETKKYRTIYKVFINYTPDLNETFQIWSHLRAFCMSFKRKLKNPFLTNWSFLTTTWFEPRTSDFEETSLPREPRDYPEIITISHTLGKSIITFRRMIWRPSSTWWKIAPYLYPSKLICKVWHHRVQKKCDP